MTLAGVLVTSGVGCARTRSAQVAENRDDYLRWWRSPAEKAEPETPPEAVVSANLSVDAAAEAELDAASGVKQASSNESPPQQATEPTAGTPAKNALDFTPILSVETADDSVSGAGTSGTLESGAVSAPPTSNSIERLQASLKEEVAQSPADSSEADSEIRYRVESILERARDSLLGKDFATARRLAENANRLVTAVNLPFRPEEERPVDLLREIESVEVGPQELELATAAEPSPAQLAGTTALPEVESSLVRSAANGAARLSTGNETYDAVEPLLPEPSQEPIQTRPVAQSATPVANAAPIDEPWYSPLDRVQVSGETMVAVDPPVLPAPKWNRDTASPEPVAVTLRDLGAANHAEHASTHGTPRTSGRRDWISFFASIAACMGVGYGFVSWILGRLRSP